MEETSYHFITREVSGEGISISSFLLSSQTRANNQKTCVWSCLDPYSTGMSHLHSYIVPLTARF